MGGTSTTDVVAQDLPSIAQIGHLLDWFDSLVIKSAMMGGYEATMEGATLADSLAIQLCIAWDDDSADAALVNLFTKIRDKRIRVEGKVYCLDEPAGRWHRCKK